VSTKVFVHSVINYNDPPRHIALFLHDIVSVGLHRTTITDSCSASILFFGYYLSLRRKVCLTWAEKDLKKFHFLNIFEPRSN